jgi:pyruvate dehydrogenase (quinone)
MNEIITIAKYWKEWKDPRLIVCILENRDLNMVTWEQRVLAGDPKFDPSQDVPGFRYDDFARSLGLQGICVDDPEKIGAAWDEALAADRPTIVSFRTDPEVPPLPPHISFEQAKNFMTSLLHDPARAAMLKQSMKEMFDSFRK